MIEMHRLEAIQRLPIDLDTAWDFFSSPANLKTITPEYMGFEITSGFKEGQKMYAGMLISYIVKPLLGIPMEWVTEITHVQDKAFFVDEQRVGPYAIWHHQHHFKAIPGGVEMHDIVDYRVPMGPIGKIIARLFIQQKVQSIFDYRYQKLETLFGQYDSPVKAVR
jgi:ligand-binding SRPBCC domain-containing protein